MKKNKWSNRDYRRGMILTFCLGIPIPSVKEAFDVMLPELPGIHRWILTVFVIAIVSANMTYIHRTLWERNDEKARQQAIEEEKEKEKQEN